MPPVLPKSPVPPPLPIDVPEPARPPLSLDHFAPAHEHIDEVREERFYLSQVCCHTDAATADARWPRAVF